MIFYLIEKDNITTKVNRYDNQKYERMFINQSVHCFMKLVKSFTLGTVQLSRI